MTILLDEHQIDQIRARGLLQTFLPAECHALLKDGDLRRVSPGEVLFGRGQWADEFGWVVAGEARAVLPGASSDVAVLDLQPGAVMGFIAFIGQGQHILEVQAKTQLDVLVMGRGLFIEARRRNDPLYARLLMVLSFGAFDRMNTIQNAIPANQLRL